MTVTAAAIRLPRFASGSAAEIAPAGFRPLNEKPAPAPVEDRMAAQNAAIAEALAAAQSAFEASRAADLAAFEQRLAERETEILASIGETLARQAGAGLEAIEERIGLQVGTVLMRFLDHAVRERAVGELTETVAALIAGGTATRIRIAGSAALTERVAAAIAPLGVPVERADSDAAEISMTIDETVVETNIAAWMDRLMAEVGAADNG